jgi:hypothetical protein
MLAFSLSSRLAAVAYALLGVANIDLLLFPLLLDIKHNITWLYTSYAYSSVEQQCL